MFWQKNIKIIYHWTASSIALVAFIMKKENGTDSSLESGAGTKVCLCDYPHISGLLHMLL